MCVKEHTLQHVLLPDVVEALAEEGSRRQNYDVGVVDMGVYIVDDSEGGAKRPGEVYVSQDGIHGCAQEVSDSGPQVC